MLMGLSFQLGCEFCKSCLLVQFIFVFPVAGIVPDANCYLSSYLQYQRMVCSLSNQLGMRETIPLPFPKFSGLGIDFVVIISLCVWNVSHDPIIPGWM